MIAFEQKFAEPDEQVAELSTMLGLPDEIVAAVVNAVSAFATVAPSPIPTAWLGVRAFWSVGANDTADTMAQALLPEAADALAALQRAGYPPALAWLLHLGVLRPQRWQHAPETVTWVLDFGKLRRDEFGELALPSHRTLQLVLEAAASLWDAHSGAGALALKGWTATVPARRRKGEVPTLTCEEAEAFCRAALARHQTQRNWHTTPRLLR
ncbi:MAG: hypothetical protein NTY53_19875, partial [Kiritimatiellaeota bacterium]|nr:hypothetical protein [Kiritimatiellota bacterium]